MTPTCNRCKAFCFKNNSPACRLGYSLDARNRTPKENCPHPLTYLALIEARRDAKDENERFVD